MKEKQYIVSTKRKPCAIQFNITTDGSQVPIYLVGYDPLTPNTFYFKSRFLITGQEDVIMNCPQSPINLKIVIWAHKDLPYQIASIKLIPFDRIEPTDPNIIFIEKFSRYAGVLRPGIFKADGAIFRIDFRRDIYRDNGSVHTTPARIHVKDPIIQVSQAKFNEMSIPERIIILTHEFAHNFLNYDQDDEVESDQNGLSIYKELGYPKIEAINAFADIMPDTDDNYERMLNLVQI